MKTRRWIIVGYFEPAALADEWGYNDGARVEDYFTGNAYSREYGSAQKAQAAAVAAYKGWDFQGIGVKWTIEQVMP